MKNVWLRFADDLLAREKGNFHLARTYARSSRFFAMLDADYATPERLLAGPLAKRLGHGGCHRFALAVGWLRRNGIVDLAGPEAIEGFALHRQEALITAVKDARWKAVLQRYYEYLLGLREKNVVRGRQAKPGHRSITLFLKAGQTFFDFLSAQGVSRETEIVQDVLDDYIATQDKSGGNGISGLVRWLNSQGRLFRKLQVTRATRPAMASHLLLGDARVNELIESFLSPADHHEGKSLLALFLLLYGQRSRIAVTFRLSDVLRTNEDGYQMRFGRVEVVLDKRVSCLMQRYLKVRRERSMLDSTGESDWLFPGLTAGTHLSHTSFSKWLAQANGISERQLWRTSLERAFRFGDLSPKTVESVTGAARTTIVRAWQSSNPRAREEMEYGSRKGKF